MSFKQAIVPIIIGAVLSSVLTAGFTIVVVRWQDPSADKVKALESQVADLTHDLNSSRGHSEYLQRQLNDKLTKLAEAKDNPPLVASNKVYPPLPETSIDRAVTQDASVVKLVEGDRIQSQTSGVEIAYLGQKNSLYYLKVNGVVVRLKFKQPYEYASIDNLDCRLSVGYKPGPYTISLRESCGVDQ